jgi:OmpA-OmpF porin, OOP family
MSTDTPRSLRRAWALALAALAFVNALASPAGAQTPTFAVDRLVMAGAPDDGVAIWRPDMANKTRFFEQVGLGLSVNPLRASNIADNLIIQRTLPGNPITRQVIDYSNLGAQIGGRLSVQVAFPVIVDQAGNRTWSPRMRTPTPDTLDTRAAGDVRIEARGLIFRTDDRVFKLALNAAVYVPTANKLTFAGDPGPGAAFGLAAEYDAGVFAIVLNAAYRYRPTVVFNELPVSSEFQYGLGMYVPLRPRTIRLGAEFFGAVGANPNKEQVYNSAPPGASMKSNVGDLDATPLEWMLNGRMYFTPGRQVYAGLGAGTRLTGGFAPDFRAVAVVGGSLNVTAPKTSDAQEQE